MDNKKTPYENALERIKNAKRTGRKDLGLSVTGLETIPPEIGELTQLEVLFLNQNPLKTLPPEIGNLVNLRSLDARGGNLTQLPLEIGNLKTLKRLDISSNRITTLPSEIGNLESLELLYMGGNRLTTLPPEIRKLDRLEELELSMNLLEVLPADLRSMVELRRLTLHSNQLTELPLLPIYLDALVVSENPLIALPEELTVKNLYIDYTRITLLPDDLVVKGHLMLGGNQIENIPVGCLNTTLFWDGTVIDTRVITHPETITADEVLAKPYWEVRRMMMERMGYKKFIMQANSTVLDRDGNVEGERQLVRIELDEHEPLVMLHVHDPSTAREYMMRVPPDMQTCHQAAAWVAGFDDPDDYNPLVET